MLQVVANKSSSVVESRFFLESESNSNTRTVIFAHKSGKYLAHTQTAERAGESISSQRRLAQPVPTTATASFSNAHQSLALLPPLQLYPSHLLSASFKSQDSTHLQSHSFSFLADREHTPSHDPHRLKKIVPNCPREPLTLSGLFLLTSNLRTLGIVVGD